MNSWNYNEVTQADLYDFKACKHNKTGEIYGIKDDATCQSGKEIDKAELERLSKLANKGDKKARAELEKIDKAEKDQVKKAKEDADAAKKKKAEEAGKKGKKGGGGKGKKGGGKGKGGKGGKGGGGAAKPAAQAQTAQQKQQARKAAMDRARDTVKQLQKMLREVTDSKARQQIQKAIGDLMKSVTDAAKADMGDAGKVQGQIQGAAKSEKS